MKYINWSDVVRKAIQETVEREEERLRGRKDIQRIREALMRNIKLERKVEGWDSVEEIRKWRDEGG